MFKLLDEVNLERYRDRGEHEGWVVVGFLQNNDQLILQHPMGGITTARADECTAVDSTESTTSGA